MIFNFSSAQIDFLEDQESFEESELTTSPSITRWNSQFSDEHFNENNLYVFSNMSGFLGIRIERSDLKRTEGIPVIPDGPDTPVDQFTLLLIIAGMGYGLYQSRKGRWDNSPSFCALKNYFCHRD